MASEEEDLATLPVLAEQIRTFVVLSGRAALLLGLGAAVEIGLPARPELGFSSLAFAALTAMGLFAAAGVALGAAQGAIAFALVVASQGRITGARVRAGLVGLARGREGEAAATTGAWVLAIPLGLVAGLLLPGEVDAFAFGAFAMLAIPLAVAVSGALARPRIRRVAGPLAFALVALAVAFRPELSAESLIPLPYAVVFALAMGQLAGAGLGFGRVRAELTIVAAFTVLGVAAALFGGGEVRRLIRERTVLAADVLRVVLARADADDDGYLPAWVGGLDCDDRDASLHPGALEISGNGLDDDCAGGDRSPGPRTRLTELVMTASVAGGRPDILLVTLDSVSAGRMSLYGYGRPTSPHLDRFAEGATVFDRAYSPGLDPTQALESLSHGIYGASLEDPARADMPIGRLMGDLGYWTTAIRATEAMLPEEFEEPVALSAGLGAASAPGLAPGLVEVAARALRPRSETIPQFMWVHLGGPRAVDLAAPGPSFGPRPQDRYDGELANLDRQLARLWAWLGVSGRLAHTVVIVASGHGEPLTRPGALSSEGLHVPLVIRIPGGRPRRVGQPVSLVDLAPTLLELAGVSAAEAPYDGRSLLPLVLGGPEAPEAAVYAELSSSSRRHWAVIESRYKLIVDSVYGYTQLYDLDADPGETRELSLEAPEVVERLEARLVDWRGRP